MSAPAATPNPLAHNPETQGNLWVAVTLPLLVFTAGIVGVRVWWRRKISGYVSSADYIVLVSLACATIQAALGCVAILKWGLGHHAAYLGKTKVQVAMMYFYIYQIWYKVLVGTTKMSFIFLYLDLFPTPKFRMVCHVINVSIVAAMIAFTLATTFQCTPVAYYWNRTIKGGHCIQASAFWYGHAAWNTVVDIIVLLLPIPVIRSLQMGRNQKFAVFGVFSLGAFVIVASVMRMISLNPASKTVAMDPTYVISTSQAFLWTQVESCVAIICICLPTLKGPLARILPGIFGISANRTTKNSYNMENMKNTDRSGNPQWKDQNGLYSHRSNGPKPKPDWDTNSSQEQIIGVKRTVDIEILHTDNTRGAIKTDADREMFRMGK